MFVCLLPDAPDDVGLGVGVGVGVFLMPRMGRSSIGVRVVSI